MLEALRREAGRQLELRFAAVRLGDLDAVAPASAWRGLEHYLGVSLRGTLCDIVARLLRTADDIGRRLAAADSPQAVAEVRNRLLIFRRAYTRAETSVDFFEGRTRDPRGPGWRRPLRACDHIATRSMAEALTPLGRQVPAALTFLDAGIGASVLKAGLRLWDGTSENPVAAIKVTRHNLLRPTSIIHEAGHQVAHMLGWNDQLRVALLATVADRRVGQSYALWASEIAADAFAFVHTGYASVAALHDVIDGPDDTVFQYLRLPTPDRLPSTPARHRVVPTELWQGAMGRDGGHLDRASSARGRAREPARLSCGLRRRPAHDGGDGAPEAVWGLRGSAIGSVVDPRRVSPLAGTSSSGSLGAAAETFPIGSGISRSGCLRSTARARPKPLGCGGGGAQEATMLRLGSLRSAAAWALCADKAPWRRRLLRC